jgi:hypothetical protein
MLNVTPPFASKLLPDPNPRRDEEEDTEDGGNVRPVGDNGGTDDGGDEHYPDPKYDDKETDDGGHEGIEPGADDEETDDGGDEEAE